jgi:hypothetical protein
MMSKREQQQRTDAAIRIKVTFLGNYAEQIPSQLDAGIARLVGSCRATTINIGEYAGSAAGMTYVLQNKRGMRHLLAFPSGYG